MTNISELESLIVETAVRKAREGAEAALNRIEADIHKLIPIDSSNPLGQMDGATWVQWKSIKDTLIARAGHTAKATAIRDFVKKYNEVELKADNQYKMRKDDPLGQLLDMPKQHTPPYPPQVFYNPPRLSAIDGWYYGVAYQN